MPVQVANHCEAQDVASVLTLLERAAQAVLSGEGSPDLEISVTVTTDAELMDLNRRYLSHDHPTDVVAFPLRDEDDPDPLLGEVVVSADRARSEAAARGISFAEELCRYVVHGCLHLMGYDDLEADDRETMETRQEELLASLLDPQ
ncbi:rRNA maturation RNase YbeY [Planctomycetota bacterium]